MSDSALVAAIRPNVYASSTTGVKKSAVTTTARRGLSCTTAPSSPFSTPTSRSAAGPSGSSLATASSSWQPVRLGFQDRAQLGDAPGDGSPQALLPVESLGDIAA